MAEREYERDEAGRFGTAGTGGGSATATVEPPAGGGASPLTPLSARAQQNIGAVETAIRGQDFETGACVTKDGQPILRKDGGKNSVEFTDAEVASLRGGVFTHNHPGGGSFSLDDVAFAGRAGLSEIRAVGPGGQRYRIQSERGETWPGLARVASAVGSADRSVRADWTPRIKDGSLSVAEANRNHWHEVWSRAAPGAGLVYVKES